MSMESKTDGVMLSEPLSNGVQMVEDPGLDGLSKPLPQPLPLTREATQL
jgi:hypothetical protein